MIVHKYYDDRPDVILKQMGHKVNCKRVRKLHLQVQPTSFCAGEMLYDIMFLMLFGHMLMGLFRKDSNLLRNNNE